VQLRHLAIPRFRNLRGLEIDFATQLAPAPGCAGAASETAPKPIRSHALIGQNGTGKSNLIEALITIFRDVDLDRDAALDFTLEYEIRATRCVCGPKLPGRSGRSCGWTARPRRKATC
jgi:hypothetical protein